MSSIATFYILPEAKRVSFHEAQAAEKRVTVIKGFLGFGTREVTTGSRYLWEYLDAEASTKHYLDHSGFVLIDYLFTFVQFPDALHEQITSATSTDGHYYQFPHPLASSMRDYLSSHPPDDTELAEFAIEQGQDSGEYSPILAATHTTVQHWLQLVTADNFGVLNLTF